AEYPEDEEELWKGQALPKEPGVVQFGTWDLTWAGAEMIPGGRLDAGFPGIGPLAVPGTYTVRLTVDGKSQTAPLVLKADPRERVPAADLEEQLRFALEIRDAITRLTRAVRDLQTVRRQLALRNEVLAAEARAEALRKASSELIGKLDALEARLHNPKAEVVYDILAQKGGTQLYSRLSPLLDIVKTGDGAPTEGARQEFAREKLELSGDEAELSRLLATDLAALNDAAGKLGLPRIYVPAGR
ncbi:MAG TPA: hypothetical protein VMM92_15415, partial [Thermoanaerobaculia bacterium]|nr:hypothetical protein [Thermoanaerobaculia bacterium]